MRLRLALLAFSILVACQPLTPDVDHALELYAQGRLNEARAELSRFLAAKPYNSRAAEAKQHILLIRRIKRLENIVLEQWQQGNVEGARRVVSALRYMHPVYLDSSRVISRIDLSASPDSKPSDWQQQPGIGIGDDPALKALIPYLLAVLDRHEEMIIHLARQWEMVKYDHQDDLVAQYALVLSSSETVMLLTAMDNAYLELLNVNGPGNPIIEELGKIAAQFDQLLLALSAGGRYRKTIFEYQFHVFKRQLLVKILDIKSRLGASKV